ncbi:MAG: hypothetical protein FWE02_06685 [Defluviitaleaceae bacterium]|nr:hypothetical protein [Defluviitaleaceae bacterium]
MINGKAVPFVRQIPAEEMGINTSLGVGQVRISTARRMEEAGLMPVPPPAVTHDHSGFGHFYSQNAGRIIALNNPRTNVLYAAAYLRYQTNRWQDEFPSISNRPDILATVYNIRNTPNSSPGSNDFGRFAAHHHDRMHVLLGLN